MARHLCLAAVITVFLNVASSWAQHTVSVPFQPVQPFVGYVEDEFILVLNASARRTLTVTPDANGLPVVNVSSLQRIIEAAGVERLQRQFPSALPEGPGSGRPDLTGYYKVSLPPGANLDSAIAAFADDPTVDHVEKIGIHTLYATPNDPFYENSPNPSFPYDQWHYWDTHGIDADLAWNTQTGDEDVVVGILDSGIRYFHVDIGGDAPVWSPDAPFSGGNIWINTAETPGNSTDDDGNGYTDDTIGWDFVTSGGGAGVTCLDQDCAGADNDPDDGDGHGTHVSGTVAAITNNDRLVAGVAGGFSDGTGSGMGNGVKVIPLRIGYHARVTGIVTGVVRMDWAAEAMNYVAGLVDAGVNVTAVNCSWGSSNSGGLDAAVDALLARDVMIVHAAGNSNSSSPDFLGGKNGVMNVAATDMNGAGASFTNHGSWVDVAAPGVDIVSTYRNPDDPDSNAHYIALLSGTSMSAPHICGIAALLESCNPSLSGPQKFALIVNNTQPYTDARNLGSGIANANDALAQAACTACAVTADFTGSPVTECEQQVVNFTDLSSGPVTNWLWDFGDDSTSVQQNPSHVYASAGIYNVSLIVSTPACADTMTRSSYITIEASPQTDFTGSPLSGEVSLTVDFSDGSTNNPTTWLWDFGDGDTSSLQNPSHTYTGVDTYTVTLVTTNGCGADTLTKTDYIAVTSTATGIVTDPIQLQTASWVYPNPFNPGTQIHFGLKEPAQVVIVIYDVSGRVVRRLLSSFYGAGWHDIYFDAMDDRGAPLASGLYFYQFRAGLHSETKKLILLK